MIEPPIPLVWAKLKPPMLPNSAVDRSTLLEDLAGSQAVLTAIVAPPGYGKTTTAVQLAHRLDSMVAWVSLEPGDSDPARFWTYVAAAIGAAGVPNADRTYAHLADGPGGQDAATLALRAALEASERAVTLVLDDLHVIENVEVLERLSDWLRHPLDNLRLICTSRSDLALPVGRLRSQGLLTEARMDKLAFSQAESSTLLERAFGLNDLTASQLHSLGRRTEGWPVGLYLAGLTLRGEPDIDAQLERFTGDTRHLTEYLAAEAMDGVSESVRAFILATSIVTVLEPDLCDAITGQPGSLKVLRDLVGQNVFTSALNESATLFHYHPLFREHLRSALAENHPEHVADLHRRASAWFETRGDVDEAIVHAAAADDVRRAEDLIGTTSARFANAGHFETIIGWVRSLGSVERLSTETCLVMAWVMLNLRRYEEMETWLRHADASASTVLEAWIVSYQRPAVYSHLARHRGDVGQMIESAAIARSAAERVPDEVTTEENPNVFVRADAGLGAAFTVSAAAAFWAGELEDSRSLMVEGLAIARETNMLIEIVFCYLYLAIIEAESGEADTAIANADQALSMIPAGEERHHQPTLAYLARSIALVRLGRPGDAAADLDRARELASIRPEPLHDAAIELHDARIRHLVGDVDGARAALRSAKAMVAAMPDPMFDAKVRAVEAEIRFVARDVDALPVGARELTDREQAVLALLPHKLSRRDLASQLHVSENTIKTHLTSIRHKLGVSGRESIVDRANELGLLVGDI